MRTEVEQVPEKTQEAFTRTVYFSEDEVKYYSEGEAVARDNELVRRQRARDWPCIDTPAFTGYLVRNQDELNELALILHQREDGVGVYPSLVWWEDNNYGRDYFEYIPLLDFYNELGGLLND